MISSKHYISAPWQCAQPVREAHFVSLHKKHEKFNVQVSLRDLEFSSPKMSCESLLYSDLQNSFALPRGRLGSGRSGFYKGKYLKGVGRTVLAANWNLSSDTYHNTGHLFPTSAIREYLITQLCIALKVEHTLVPCEGILTSRLDSQLKPQVQSIAKHLKTIFGSNFYNSPNIDNRLSCISIKDARFARLSNFLWLFSYINESGDLGENLNQFFQLLATHLDVNHPDDPDIDKVFAKLAQAATKSLDNFWAYQRVGIDWSSYHNNFAIDGRFLDLEVPRYFGGAVLGHVETRREKAVVPDVNQINIKGFAFIAYQWKAFVTYLDGQLSLLAKTPRLRGNDVLTGILSSLRSHFSSEHPVMSGRELFRYTKPFLIENYNLSAKEAEPLLRHLIHTYYDDIKVGKSLPFDQFFETSAKTLSSQGGCQTRLHVLRHADFSSIYRDRIDYFSELVSQVELARTPEDLNERLLQAAIKIKNYWK